MVKFFKALFVTIGVLLGSSLLMMPLFFNGMIVTDDMGFPNHKGYKGAPLVETNPKGATILSLNSIMAKTSPEFEEVLQHFQGINTDTVGVIQIPEFGLEYPVLFAGDNKKYLRTNIYGESDVQGAIYIDANYKDSLSPVKLLHGHNMKDGTMFACLPQMLKWETLDTAPGVLYYDSLGLKTFKIISVFSVNAKEESLIVKCDNTLAELEELKQNYIDRSWVPCSDIPGGIELLMLNTCWYGESGAEHFLHCIVVAVRVE